jgi:DNA-binding transcriptional regulator YdaS (Cro superfamily)
MERENSLRKWSSGPGASLTWLAEQLNVSVSTVSRWVTGETLPDADMVARIGELTGGAVTAHDMHQVRLAWLKANRPEKFAAAMRVA